LRQVKESCFARDVPEGFILKIILAFVATNFCMGFSCNAEKVGQFLRLGFSDVATLPTFFVQLRERKPGINSTTRTLTRPSATLSHRMGEGRGEGFGKPFERLLTVICQNSSASCELKSGIDSGQMSRGEAWQVDQVKKKSL
jgi:hypothetical protein